jgi:short-subunit dehydrogenase
LKKGALSSGHAVVFGATGGLGRALAKKLEENGWTAEGVARSDCDLASPASVAAWLSRTEARGTGIDLCIFASGASDIGSLDDAPAEAFRRCLEINCLGPLTILLSLAKSARPCRNFIVTLSGTAHLLLPRLGPYSLGKRALRDVLYVRKLERSLRSVYVLEVWPGPMKTDFNRKTVRHGRVALPRNARAREPEAVAEIVLRAFAKRRARVSLSPIPDALGRAQTLLPGITASLWRFLAGRAETGEDS